jgi:hypothetical protein
MNQNHHRHGHRGETAAMFSGNIEGAKTNNMFSDVVIQGKL